MKKILLFLSLIILLIPIYGKAIVRPTEEFYINDYANILSSETEEYILQRSLALHAADGTQIVVVTVPNLEGMSLEKYANDLFNSFGIGDKEKDNGLLLLLALEERQFRVEVGDGLGGILPDGKTGRFQDNYIIPYLREDKWDEGIKNGYDAFYAEIVKENNLEIDYSTPIDVYEQSGNYTEDVLPISGLFLSGLIGYGIGKFIKGLTDKKRKLYTTLYFILWGLLTVFAFFNYVVLFILLIINIFLFIIGRFSSSSNNSSSRRYYYLGSHSRSRSSSSRSRGFSGGGGFSSGGGSSRRF